MLIDLPVRDLLAAFSSTDPTPGGGSASALSSAIGASLLMMVAGLPKTRTGSEEDRTRLASAVEALTSIHSELTLAIDADTRVYNEVVAAYRMPKASPAEQESRKASIQRALRGATDVPMGVMRLSAAAIDQSLVIAAHGHAAAASDVGVGIAMLHTGLHGARLNVDINLGSLTDAEYQAAISAEATRVAEHAAETAEAAEELLRHR